MKTLLLDVMGTLVHDPFYEEMPRWLGLSFDELLAQKDPHAWVDFEFGAIDQEVFAERFFADRRPLDGEALRGICLLYTSPSPRDKRQSRMPSSA